MAELVGKRLQVNSRQGYNLGLGTYLWDDEILLDSGKKIQSNECSWQIVAPSDVPPFDIVLVSDTRVFEGEDNLRNTGYYMHEGDRVRVEEVRVCGWNHGGYVAGKFFFKSKPYWLLMSEVELPKETPHLRLVT